MTKVVHAEGDILRRIVATTPLVASRGLSREAFAKYDAAQAKTAWALRHRRRFALMQADDVLASAERYDLTARLDRQVLTTVGSLPCATMERWTMAVVTEASSSSSYSKMPPAMVPM